MKGVLVHLIYSSVKREDPGLNSGFMLILSLIITRQLNNLRMVFTAQTLEIFFSFSTSLFASVCKEVYIKQV